MGLPSDGIFKIRPGRHAVVIFTTTVEAVASENLLGKSNLVYWKGLTRSRIAQVSVNG